jgi:hypothetical protein
MNYDYQQTQAEVTYYLVGMNEWAFKKIAAPGGTDMGAGPENQLFDAHRAEMSEAGWALVSMAASPTALQLIALKASELSRTSNYELFWKRIKARPCANALDNATAVAKI